MEPKKTHKEVKEPQITVQGLADYMGAKSERAKRNVVQSYRYRSKARVIQYNEGKAVCSSYLRKGGALLARAEEIAARMADDDFTLTVNKHNSELIKAFAVAAGTLKLPCDVGDIERGKDYDSILVNGVKITMRANLVLHRKTKNNKLKVGALMFRYSKGKALDMYVGGYQSAAIFGYLRTLGNDEGAEPEKALCLTLDAFCCQLTPAPGKSVDMWNDMKAAGLTIAERWPNIPPPPNAVL